MVEIESGSDSTHWALTHIDLASERYGGQVLECNDEFFAQASNLVKTAEPVFIEDKYTDRGKWMDGWESRRKRTEGYDWSVLRLGIAGLIRAIDVNTTFFRGNAPSDISIEACCIVGDPDQQTEWHPLVKQQAVEAHSHNWVELNDERRWTHLRLNIFPDGGVARLRIYGEPKPDRSNLLENELIDLASSVQGGRAIACSDMFFSPMNNIIAPGRGINMGDGWETRRRRGPGHDWLIVKLACAGTIARVIIDTCHFKGNFPDSCTLEAACLTEGEDVNAAHWQPLLASTKLLAHSEHYFQTELLNLSDSVSHVRLNIFPDGGVSRLRILGYPAEKN